MADVTIPNDLWEEDVEGVITSWMFEDGESVTAGAVIAELMVEKVQHELTAPAAGVLAVLKAAEEPVKKGETVARIDAR